MTGISSISGYGMSNYASMGTSAFQRTNAAVVQTGQQKAAKISEETKSYTDVSNFGNETKIGKSRFQQENAKIAEDGASSIAKAKEKLKSYTDGSNFGNGTNTGTSMFQKGNAKIAEMGKQSMVSLLTQAKQAYTKGAAYSRQSGLTLDISA